MSGGATAGRTSSSKPDQGVLTTNRVDDFIGWLRPADVVLFDTLHPLSHLIKLAENRPVNHCALYLGEGQVAHVGRHVPDPKKRGAPPLVPAARTTDLRQWLADRPHGDRTVTALRHAAARQGGDPAPVLSQSRRYTDSKTTTYDYLSLLALAVPCLLRTYRHQLATSSPTSLTRRSLLSGMRAVSAAVLVALELRASPSRKAGSMSLTCSEFVYRCFDQAGPTWSVEVTEPIGRWSDPDLLRRSPPRRTRARTLAPVVMTVEQVGPHHVVSAGEALAFDPCFRADVLGAMPVELEIGTAAPRWRGDAAGGMDMAEAVGELLVACIEKNRRAGKYEEAADTVQAGDIFPDLVTPKDLWASSSLSAAAVFHRPPDPGDRDLDGWDGHPGVLGG